MAGPRVRVGKQPQKLRHQYIPITGAWETARLKGVTDPNFRYAVFLRSADLMGKG